MKRQCSDCQLCCTLIPVEEIHKVAGQKCKHQKFKVGCSIYQNRPLSCRFWSCAWLVDPFNDAHNLSRPDRSHYVIDIAVTTLGVNGKEVPCIQIWCDPKYPDAHRDPALRTFLEHRSHQGYYALVRYNSWDGIALLAPAFTHDGKWHEVPSNARESTLYKNQIEAYEKVEKHALSVSVAKEDK